MTGGAFGRLGRWVKGSQALRDLAWMTTANVLVKPAWFLFVTAVCMRVLGASGYGVFVSTLALAGIVMALTEMGVVEFATREIARDRACAPSLFSNLVAARLGLGLASVAVAVVAVAWGALGEGTAWPTVAAAGLYVLGLRVSELCRALYRASEAFSQDAVSTLAERLLSITCGAAGLFATRSAAGLLVGLAAGAGLSSLCNLAWIRWRHRALDLRLVRARVFRTAYSTSFPIGLFSLFAIVFHGAGPILLASISGDAAAGQYGAAWRVVELYMLVPSLVTAVVLPRLSELGATGAPSAFRRLFARSALALGAGSVALAGATALAAGPIVSVLAGDADFGAATGLLRLLALAFPMMSLSMLLSSALIAADRQWDVAVIIGVSAAVHVAASVALTPVSGGQGVALAMVGAYVLVIVGQGWALLRATRTPFTATERAGRP